MLNNKLVLIDETTIYQCGISAFCNMPTGCTCLNGPVFVDQNNIF